DMGSSSRGPRCAVSALRSKAIRVALVTCLIAACATAARAQTGTQTGVRVTRDQSTIWQSNFATPAAVVDAGTVLTVVGHRGDWYEVTLPGGQSTGFIYRGTVDDSWSVPPRAVGFFGFFQFGYTQFAARNSFEAVVGQPGGGFLGGGAEVRF